MPDLSATIALYSLLEKGSLLLTLQRQQLSTSTPTSARTPASQSTIAPLDGVRAIACLSVIIYHLHYFMYRASYDIEPNVGKLGKAIISSGWSGVTLFFVLSGFLLFMPYAKYLLFALQRPSTRIFYWRRILRIIPGYYLALVLLTLFMHPEYLQPAYFSRLILFPLFLMDSPTTYQQIDGPFWTLAVEWQYYMLLPLLVWGFGLLVKQSSSPQRRFWRTIICLTGMVLWGISTRYVGYYYTTLHPTATILVSRPVLNVFLLLTYGSTGKYFEDFAIGMLCSLIYTYTRNSVQENKVMQTLDRHSMWLWGAGVLLLLFMSCWSIYHHLAFLEPFIGNHRFLSEMGYASGYGLCIVAILFGPPGLKMLFSWSPLRWIGSLSYGMYIWHVPFLALFETFIVKKIATTFISTYALYWASVVLVTIPLAYLLYRFIERPCMQLGKRTPVPQSRSQ